MKALILAGGYGTRLRPLTYTRPKHLLPIVNRPHIEHVFDLLARHGVYEVVMLTSYLAGAFASAIEDAAARGMRVAVTHEEEPLGTAGAIKHAEGFIGEERFLVFNGDVLTDIEIGDFVARHDAAGAVASIALTPVEDPSAFGVVPTEPDGRVLGFIEKPERDAAPTNMINAGIYVMEPAVLEKIPRGEPWSAERALFPQLVDDDAGLFAFDAGDAYWMDIGTPEKYLQANLDALAGRWDAGAPPGGVAADGAEIDAGARVSSACLGAGCRVEDGAEVTRSVLLPGVTVMSGARVRDSVLGESVVVSSGADLAGAAVGDGATVAPRDEVRR